MVMYIVMCGGGCFGEQTEVGDEDVIVHRVAHNTCAAGPHERTTQPDGGCYSIMSYVHRPSTYRQQSVLAPTHGSR